MSASLAVVANNPAPEAASPAEEPLTARIRRLQAEAKSMAREHIHMLEASITEVARLATEIADGGDAYPVGVREMARQMVAECESRSLGLEAIMHRTSQH
jgi:hypothetical protein